MKHWFSGNLYPLSIQIPTKRSGPQVKEWSWIVIACSFLVLAFTEKQIMFGVLGLSFLTFAFND
ncbi:hypothetical protein DUI31_15360 [Enterococcus faecalis]|nr:hypothetical protein [Enterococcus faecalis]EGO9066673.1 hypothetical protein [Enterococcus faecalis]